MDPDFYDDENTIFSRRTFILGAVQATLLTAVAGRLIYLGGTRASHYQTLAKDNRVKLHVILPERGAILDKNGIPLATNQHIYRLLLQPEGHKFLKRIYHKLKTLIDFGHHSFLSLKNALKECPRHLPLLLKEPLPWEEVCRIEMAFNDLPYIIVEKGQRRFYPKGDICCHVVGYVQIPTLKDKIEPALMFASDFRLGRLGLEKEYDTRLRGMAGFKEIEVNALRRIQRTLSIKHGRPGPPLQTTLDLRIQKKAYDLLQPHKGAAAVVMNVKTGAIETMVSHPSYNPHVFTEGISHENWKVLNENVHGILTNKVIKGQYAPGSLFKMIVALAGLECQKITPQTQIICKGYTDLNGHRFHCHTRHGHGTVHLEKALSRSCDVYFYEISKYIGIDFIAAMAQRFGFGQPTQFVLGEKTGCMPTKKWMQAHFKRSWRPADTLLTSIGQGNVLATPLQMVTFMAALANDGFYIKPRLTLDEPFEKKELFILPRHMKCIQHALFQTVNSSTGTGRRARLPEPYWHMSGKTATSQVRRISQHERDHRVLSNKEIEWKRRDHAIFGGYAPSDQPRYACVVLVEHGGSGSLVAAPIARDILRALLQRDDHV